MTHGDPLPDASVHIKNRPCRIVNRTFIERPMDETETQAKLRILKNQPPVMLRYVVGRIER
jgi:hypothetical protein